MKVKYIFLFFLVSIVFFSCTFVRNKSVFKDFRKSSSKSEMGFKIDGYYYNKYNMATPDNVNEKLIRPIIFYKDGTARVFPLFSGIKRGKDGEFISNENTFEKAHKIFEDELKNIKEKGNYSTQDMWGWGNYNVVSDSLLIIQYYLIGTAAIPIPIVDYTLHEYKGKIINDTTFIINKKKDFSYDGSKDNLNEIYKFKKFSPKPDSTNWTQDL